MPSHTGAEGRESRPLPWQGEGGGAGDGGEVTETALSRPSGQGLRQGGIALISLHQPYMYRRNGQGVTGFRL